MTLQELRVQIVLKHARRGRNGFPSQCPHARGVHPGGKIIYRTRGAAERCAAELFEWASGLAQEAYECPFGAHFHLTKAEPGGAR